MYSKAFVHRMAVGWLALVAVASTVYAYPYVTDAPFGMSASVIADDLRDIPGRPYQNLAISYNGNIECAETLANQFAENHLNPVFVYPTILIRNLDSDVIIRPNRMFYSKCVIIPEKWTERRGDFWIRFMRVTFSGALTLSTFEGDSLIVYVTLGPVTTYHLPREDSPNAYAPVDSIDYFWDDIPPLTPDDFFTDHSILVRSQRVYIPSEVIPLSSQIVFQHFIKPGGQIDSTWLPVYGDTIGVVMDHVDTGSSEKFRYHIWDVSTWQGICINYPINAPQPECIPDSSYDFDFEIVNTENYWIKTFSRDEPSYNTIIEKTDIENRFKARVGENGNYSFRGWDLVKKWSSRQDTLWLRILDYGAKCMISPRQGSKTQNRMNAITDIFGRSEFVLSLPSDYDGFYDYGCNYGDGMADAWEKTFVDSTKEIYDILPFTQWTNDKLIQIPPADHCTSDLDSIGQGRLIWHNDSATQIYGDRLCNFVEYRGFTICGDDSAIFPQEEWEHCRTDIRKKTVFYWIAPIFPDTVKDLFPGYISCINDSLEVYFVDSIPVQKLPNFSKSVLYRKNGVGRTATTNCFGAKRFYFGYPQLTFLPILEEQNCVPYWPFDLTQMLVDVELNRNSDNALGFITGGYWIQSKDTIYYPLDTYFASIYFSNAYFTICDTDSFPYYVDHPDSLATAWRFLVKSNIAHEFGHTVGMQHTMLKPSIMYPYIYVVNSNDLDNRRVSTHNPFFETINFEQTAVRKPTSFPIGIRRINRKINP